MKKLALIAGLVLISQVAFAVIVTNGAACTTTGATAYNGSQQQVVCTNGVWAAPVARAAVGAAALGAVDGTTVNNTVNRTVVAPGADAAARAAAVPGTAATRTAARVPGTPATRNAAARGRAAVRRPGR